MCIIKTQTTHSWPVLISKQVTSWRFDRNVLSTAQGHIRAGRQGLGGGWVVGCVEEHEQFIPLKRLHMYMYGFGMQGLSLMSKSTTKSSRPTATGI